MAAGIEADIVDTVAAEGTVEVEVNTGLVAVAVVDSLSIAGFDYPSFSILL